MSFRGLPELPPNPCGETITTGGGIVGNGGCKINGLINRPPSRCSTGSGGYDNGGGMHGGSSFNASHHYIDMANSGGSMVGVGNIDSRPSIGNGANGRPSIGSAGNGGGGGETGASVLIGDTRYDARALLSIVETITPSIGSGAGGGGNCAGESRGVGCVKATPPSTSNITKPEGARTPATLSADPKQQGYQWPETITESSVYNSYDFFTETEPTKPLIEKLTPEGPSPANKSLSPVEQQKDVHRRGSIASKRPKQEKSKKDRGGEIDNDMDGVEEVTALPPSATDLYRYNTRAQLDECWSHYHVKHDLVEGTWQRIRDHLEPRTGNSIDQDWANLLHDIVKKIGSRRLKSDTKIQVIETQLKEKLDATAHSEFKNEDLHDMEAHVLVGEANDCMKILFEMLQVEHYAIADVCHKIQDMLKGYYHPPNGASTNRERIMTHITQLQEDLSKIMQGHLELGNPAKVPHRSKVKGKGNKTKIRTPSTINGKHTPNGHLFASVENSDDSNMSSLKVEPEDANILPRKRKKSKKHSSDEMPKKDETPKKDEKAKKDEKDEKTKKDEKVKKQKLIKVKKLQGVKKKSKDGGEASYFLPVSPINGVVTLSHPPSSAVDAPPKQTTKPPPPSVEDLTLTVPKPSKKPRVSDVSIEDHNPNRISNPLLEVPQYPIIQKGFAASSLPFELRPQGSELWNLTDLYFPEPDTFPVSYYATLLGFDASATTINPKTCPVRCTRNEPWLMIPKPGKFASRVLRKSYSLPLMKSLPQTPRGPSEDASGKILSSTAAADEDMYYIDPLWTDIKMRFNGYNDDVFRAAAIHDSKDRLSYDCIAYAKKRGIIDDTLTFRAANPSDVGSLDDLIKDTGLYSDSHSLDRVLRCPTQFVILAICKEKGTIGFIHYKFCWYTLENSGTSATSGATQDHYGVGCTAGMIKKQKSMELVLYVERVQYKGKDSSNGSNTEKTSLFPTLSNDCDNAGAIVLTSLALEHARQLDVWYSMMETPILSTSFYKTFFRMIKVVDQNRKGVSKTACMVCDLKKCSYRYACFLKEEMSKSHNPAVQPIASLRERMLVCLPYVTNATSPTSKKSICRRQTHGDDRHTMKKKSKKGPPCYAGPHKEIKWKRLNMQLMQRNGSITLIEAPSDKSTTDYYENSATISEPADWKVLRAFSLPTDENSSDSNLGQCDNDSVLTELKMRQDELLKLEESMVPKLRDLLGKSYEERLQYESVGKEQSIIESIARKDYDAVIDRRREADLAWQLQLDQDMDAVCDVCNDGEVTPGNQILFCEACNVAVHQICYGITEVPDGDYFCRACRHFGRDKHSKTSSKHGVLARRTASALPICCELCPRKQGAFIKTRTKKIIKNRNKDSVRWVHATCAKWQGFNYVEGTDREIIEDVTEVKSYFLKLGVKCILCKGARGTYNKCNVKDCNNWMHITCARSSGICSIAYGENHVGIVESDEAWTLRCPEHSKFDDDYVLTGNLTIEQLEAAAKAFHNEIIIKVPPRPFHKMNVKERRKHLSDPDYEAEFLEKLMGMKDGARCEVCNTHTPEEISGSDKNILKRCSGCQALAHMSCLYGKEWTTVKGDDGAKMLYCFSCSYTMSHKSSADFRNPRCHMCHKKDGALLHASADPMRMKRWRDKSKLKRSLFGLKIWCHPICGIWHPKTRIINGGTVNCQSVIMGDGVHHIEGRLPCLLCGRKDKVKVMCTDASCKNRFHLTCARQAGLDVSERDGNYILKCFKHCDSSFVLRALLEDMIEVERNRAGVDLSNGRHPMSMTVASKIFNWGIQVLKCLGWAWQWSEWWVANGDNWEPLLEEGQREADMTVEELRIVETTELSRCEDARRCRLAAFGAALRNRNYDGDKGNEALDRALRAILSTRSLVGPLRKVEINFFAEWLGRVYRSKSPILGFGDNKILVENSWEEDSVVHFHDKSPKHSLGCRQLPGQKVLPKGIIFEIDIKEVDNFMRSPPVSSELFVDQMKIPRKKRCLQNT